MNLKLQYRDLEQRVFAILRNKISESKEDSKHLDVKCIKVNVFNYTELAIINDQLIFLDKNGMQYSYWNSDCNLEDLIDLINK